MTLGEARARGIARAVVVCASAIVIACGPSATRGGARANDPYDEQEAEAARAEERARRDAGDESDAPHVSANDASASRASGGIEDALEAISLVCGDARLIDGECAARTVDLCVVMKRMARACFDASAAPARCDALRDDVAVRMKKRSLGARASQAVSSFCEAACEVRQTGHSVIEAEAKLDELCAGR